MKKKLSFAILALSFLISLLFLVSWSSGNKGSRTYYQLTVYQYTTNEQEKMLDDYLQQAYIPALHRMKIMQVGVFKVNANDTAVVKKIYVLIPVKSFGLLAKLPEKIAADKEYQAKGTAYIDAAYTAPPYTRMETIVLQAFSMAPELQLPVLTGDKKERIYELRSYESATEKIFKNKVHMFNEGDEIGLFKRLNFNAIFYGEVISGSKMPNLMYMTSFENMTDRDAHWKKFVSDTTWKRLSSIPEYKNNVSKNEITFLHPASYSDY